MSNGPDFRLTQRELQVAHLVSEGLTDREIAARLFIGRRTAEWHLKQIFNKLGFSSRAQVASWVAREGAATPGSESIARRTNNLPVQLSTFIGRMPELAEIPSILGATRLITFVGFAGAGKTRLALEVAARTKDSYADGTWFVDLTPIKDERLVSRAFGSALGLRERPRQPMAETLIEHLSPLSVLLMADNCEHVLDAAAALIDAVLRACPGVTVLATSRERLRVDGETVWRVRPLTVPDVDVDVGPNELVRYEAVDLFVDRAQLSAPGFAMSQENARSVAELCRRLDGMPLAIELAAARAGSMSPDQILNRLRDRFALLSGGSRAGPSRHRTLESALDWSHDLLTDEERMVFRRLAVFAGTFGLDAAEVISAGDLDPNTTARSVSDLVDKSLVVATGNGSNGTRFRLLEAVQQYGMDQLTEAGEVDLISRRHCDFFVSLAEVASPNLEGPDQQTWHERLGQDIGNLRSALDWSSAHEPALNMRLSNALTFFWYMHGLLQEGDAWIKAALSRSSTRDRLRAEALGNSGQFSFWRADLAASSAAWQEALELYRELGDRTGVGRGLRWVAEGLEWNGDDSTAREYFQEALEIAVEAGEATLAAHMFRHLGRLAMKVGDHVSARDYLGRSIAVFEETGDSVPLIWALGYLALDAIEEGDLAAARSALHRGLRLAQAYDLTIPIASMLIYFGAMEAAQSNAIRALKLAGAAESLATSAGAVPTRLTRPIVERWFDRSRQELGPVQSKACWEEGAAMSRERAIEFALESSI
jgi:non-specific serine/threonine protein kinase